MVQVYDKFGYFFLINSPILKKVLSKLFDLYFENQCLKRTTIKTTLFLIFNVLQFSFTKVSGYGQKKNTAFAVFN